MSLVFNLFLCAQLTELHRASDPSSAGCRAMVVAMMMTHNKHVVVGLQARGETRSTRFMIFAATVIISLVVRGAHLNDHLPAAAHSELRAKKNQT